MRHHAACWGYLMVSLLAQLLPPQTLTTRTLYALDLPDGNRLAYLDGPANPFHASLRTPRLETPQWMGADVDAVVILAIDDMRATEKYERYLRPIINRLAQIDGRAAISIMTNAIDPRAPQLLSWLDEGLSIECHSMDHPCPILAGGDFAAAKSTYDRNVDLLHEIPGNRPVAFRVPCMDSINSPSPRFFREIFCRTTTEGHFLQIDSSVCNVTTADDTEIPREWALDADGSPRFSKYLPFESFVNTIENYPYPYVIDRLCWEFPTVVPSDWEAQNLHGVNQPRTVLDLRTQLDIVVRKRGAFTLVFHPHGWIRNDQIVEFIDYAVKRYGKRVRFINFQEALENLEKNALDGESLRESDGGDRGARFLDVDADGYMDLCFGGSRRRFCRIWLPGERRWRTIDFPLSFVGDKGEGSTDLAPCIGVLGERRYPVILRANAKQSAAWRFDGQHWARAPELLRGLEISGHALLTGDEQGDTGLRFRDVDGDGDCELIAAGPSQRGMLRWSELEERWREVPFALHSDAMFVDESGRDAGLRLADIDEDGHADFVFSGKDSFSLQLWNHKTSDLSPPSLQGKRSETKPSNSIPSFVKSEGEAGAWFHSRHLWIQNEDTAHLPQNVDRRSYAELIRNVRAEPRSPEQALSSFHVKPGFRVELVAAEPLVRDPVSFDWDTEGRLWVVEMSDYPLGVSAERGQRGLPGGRVVVLSDRDGDGSYDHSTVFLDGLSFPTTVKTWKAGALILANPRIIYAEDRDDDGHADHVEALYEGFAHGNEQHLANTFALGLDGWLYCANGDSGGKIRSLRSGAILDLRGRDFRIHPETGAIEPQSGSTQFGRVRDDWGNWFGCNNPNPMYQFVLDDRYLARNPHYAPPASRHYVVPGGGRVYPTSRTLPRFNDFHMANRFTSCCGLTIFRSDRFGPSFLGDAFVSEPVHNLVHHIDLERRGTTFSGKRPVDEQEIEFLTSSDNWFRPTSLRVGPDGALWIADMYREVIEHPQYFFTGAQEDLDSRAGDDRGRIYRVVPADTDTDTDTDRGADSDLALPKNWIAALQSTSGWQRDKALELILQGDSSRYSAGLEKVLTTSKLPAARVNALAALAGWYQDNQRENQREGLSSGILELALADSHPAVRRLALRIAGDLWKGRANVPPIALRLIDDGDASVRMQIAHALGNWSGDRVAEALAALLLREDEDRFVHVAAMSSVLPHLGPILREFSRLERATPGQQRTLHALLSMTTSLGEDGRRHIDAIWPGLTRINADGYQAWQLQSMATLLEQLPLNASRLESTAKLVRHARSVLESDSAGIESTRSALGLLGVWAAKTPDTGEAFLANCRELFSPKRPTTIHDAALSAARTAALDDTPDAFLSSWISHTPRMRRGVLDLILERDPWIPALLKAVEQGPLSPSDIDAARRRRLTGHRDSRIAARASKLFSTREKKARQDVIASFQVAKQVSGDPAAGWPIFEKKCGPCHRLNHSGHAVGPDLAALGDKSFDRLLADILDPDRRVESKFQVADIILRDGRVLSGLIQEESASSLTLLAQEARTTTILRHDIDRFESSGKSMMPEGLEEGMSPTEMAHLIAAIRSQRSPPKSFSGNRPITVEADSAGILELRAQTAEVRGSTLIFEPRYGNLGFWKSLDDNAEWRFVTKSETRYEIVVRWACPEDIAGNRLRVTVDNQKIEAHMESTGSWDTYREVSLGYFQLNAGEHILNLRAAPGLRDFLFDFQRFRLTPAPGSKRTKK